jgi:hypothetical protein
MLFLALLFAEVLLIVCLMQRHHIAAGLLKLVWWHFACELLLHYLLLWVHIRTQSPCCPHTAASRKDTLSVGFSAVSIENKN